MSIQPQALSMKQQNENIAADQIIRNHQEKHHHSGSRQQFLRLSWFMLKLFWLHILIVLNCEHKVLKSNSLSLNPLFSPSCSALYFPSAPKISREVRRFSPSDG